MTANSPTLISKAPHMGTTIFTVMSALAAEKKAVNLGQGFPDFPCDPRLTDLVNDAMRDGHNQYPPMPGVAPLREAVAAKIEALYGRRYNPASEITVTAGATQAILAIILAIVGFVHTCVAYHHTNTGASRRAMTLLAARTQSTRACFSHSLTLLCSTVLAP